MLIPAAYGLAGVNLATYTGWDTVTYWNAFVANLEMHGQGNFYTRVSTMPRGSRWPRARTSATSHNLGRLPGLKFMRTLWACSVAGAPSNTQPRSQAVLLSAWKKPIAN